MASRAGAAPDWRAAFRRSFRRATHMAGAGLLFVLLVFLTLALASYTQTDPSPSTAASDANIGNQLFDFGNERPCPCLRMTRV